MTSSPDKLDIDEKDCFYFESDHLALKGNKDYNEVLKTLFILEAQRSKLLEDYEVIVKLKKEALNDPLSIVEKLKNGESLNIPDAIQVVEVPKINWSKYNLPIPESLLKEINDEKKLDEKEQQNNIISFKSVNGTRKKKTWTVEEQRRLEELLIEYPPEDVELKRFRKIANALGNTTVQQVCSRLQKYFIKLHKMGLPIPGRIPRSIVKKKTHKHQRHNHFLFKPSTFFPQLNVPVTMDDSDECPGPQKSNENDSSRDNTNTKNYLLSNSYLQESNVENNNKTSAELQIDLLKMVRSEKLKMNNMNDLFKHYGYSCNYCNEEPITGSRWHCATCVTDSIDFCTDCVIAQISSENCHPLNHQLITIRGNNETNSTDTSEEEEEEESDDETSTNNCDSEIEYDKNYFKELENEEFLSQPSNSSDTNHKLDNFADYNAIFTHKQEFLDCLDDSLLFDDE